MTELRPAERIEFVCLVLEGISNRGKRAGYNEETMQPSDVGCVSHIEVVHIRGEPFDIVSRWVESIFVGLSIKIQIQWRTCENKSVRQRLKQPVLPVSIGGRFQKKLKAFFDVVFE